MAAKKAWAAHGQRGSGSGRQVRYNRCSQSNGLSTLKALRVKHALVSPLKIRGISCHASTKVKSLCGGLRQHDTQGQNTGRRHAAACGGKPPPLWLPKTACGGMRRLLVLAPKLGIRPSACKPTEHHQNKYGLRTPNPTAPRGPQVLRGGEGEGGGGDARGSPI